MVFLAAGFLAGAFLAAGAFVAGFAAGFFVALSLTPAALASFANTALRRAAVCLLSTFFLTAVSIFAVCFR